MTGIGGTASSRTNPRATQSACSELAPAKLEAYNIAKVVAEALPLSPEQRRIIAPLLYTGGGTA